jgi:hypothetical protein
MRASAIRQLASAQTGRRIAAAFVQRTVEIWDLLSSQRLSEIQTVFDCGGSRLALNRSGDKCITAGWAKGVRGGVACYDPLGGSSLWHRTDIRQTQFVRFSHAGERVWCGRESGPLLSLDATSGATVETLAGIKRVFDGPYSDTLLVETRTRGLLIRAPATSVRVPALTFAVLDAALSPECLCVSEAGGPVRCLDSMGNERWRYNPPSRSHVLRLCYRPADCSFYGVLWEYERGTFRELIRLSAETGQSQAVRQLRSWDEEFCSNGDALVTSNGEVISANDGSVAAELAFPQTDYPDAPITA